MVHITITPGRIAARGHAGDSAGCAAVSALLYALAGGLENIGQAGRWRIGGGDAEIEIPGAPEAQLLRLMAEVGLRQVAAVRQDIRIADAGRQPRRDALS